MKVIDKLNLLGKIWNVPKDNTDYVSITLNTKYKCYLWHKGKLLGTCSNYENAQRWLNSTSKGALVITIANANTPKKVSIFGKTAVVRNADTAMQLREIFGDYVRIYPY